jgi:hypothetical protein
MKTATAKKKLGLPEKIMIGLVLGIATGVFLGELAAPLNYVGDAIIGMLQMTVLPYIKLALKGGIGKLTGAQSRLWLGRVSLIILFFWFIGYMTVYDVTKRKPLRMDDWAVLRKPPRRLVRWRTQSLVYGNSGLGICPVPGL